MSASQYRTDGIVFKAAIAIGFAFYKRLDSNSKNAVTQDCSRFDIEDYLNARPFCEATKTPVNFSGVEPGKTGWIQGYQWTLPLEDGVRRGFSTMGDSDIRREMLRQLQAKNIAKAARDPKTPPRTMKTRKDTI